MDARPDVYLFGQVLGTHSFLLKGGFLPGGETDMAATFLAPLGVSVRMGGSWIGTEVAPMLRAFSRNNG